MSRTAPPPTLENLLCHAEWLRSFAGRLARDDADADDLVQDTFVAALTNPPREDRGLRGWLATVARNLARRAREREARRLEREAAAARPERDGDAARAAARLDLARRMAGAILALAPHEREVVLLRYLDGRTPAEIGERLGVPASTVRSRLARARARLRREIAPDSRGRHRLAFAGGILLMSTKTKAATAAAVILLALVGAVVSLGPRADEPRPAGPPDLSATPIPVAPEETAAPTAADATPPPVEAPAERAPGNAPPGNAPPGAATDVVAGRVLDSAGGRTIEGASVRLLRYMGDEGREVATDPWGAFAIGDVPAGRYTLLVEHEGYAPETVTGLWVGEGRDSGNLSVALVGDPARVGTITGRVTNGEGRGIAGAEIRAANTTAGLIVRAVTDEEGRYRFPMLHPATWFLGWIREDGAAETVNRKVAVEAGGTAVVDFSAKDDLRGRILRPDRTPLAGTRVNLSSAADGTSFARTDEAGVFRLPIPTSERATVGVLLTDRGIFSLSLGEFPRAELSGGLEIVLPDTRLALGIGPASPGASETVSFLRIEGRDLRTPVACLQRASRAKEVDVRWLPPGHYAVTVQRRGWPVAEGEVEIRTGEACRLAIELPKVATGSVRATVRDGEGKPVDGIAFLGVPDRTGKPRQVRATPQAPGAYLLQRLEAGGWSMSVWHAGWRSESRRVRVPAGGVAEVEFVLERK